MPKVRKMNAWKAPEETEKTTDEMKQNICTL